MKPKNLVIYHGEDCADGLMSAYLMSLYLDANGLLNEEDSQFLPYTYDMAPPKDIADRIIYIVDFSFPKETILEMAKEAYYITLLDHHATAADHFGGYGKDNILGLKSPIVYEIDETRCGCKIVYDYLKLISDDMNQLFYQNPMIGKIVDYISDRDLWNFNLPETKAFYAVWQKFVTHGQFNQVQELINLGEEKLSREMALAQYVLNFKDQQVRQLARQAEFNNLFGYQVPCVNVPKVMASDVGEALCNLFPQSPFSVTYVILENKVRVSLRSKKETGINVKELAERKGGGGHVNASGFFLTLEELNSIFNTGSIHDY